MVQNIISSLGGGSGIDTKALVEGLVAAERAPRETIIDSKTKTLDTQISGYGALRSSMTGIQDSVKLLADPDTFNARNVTFADTRLVSPTSVDAGSVTGNYSVNVTALAAAHSLSAGGFSDMDAVVGSGTLEFSFGDWATDYSGFTTNADKASKTLTIDGSNNSLRGIRDAINDGDFGAQASIIKVGSTYTLQITSASGEDNELQIGVTEGVPAGLAALSYEVGSRTMAEGVRGADSAFSVNGLAITRSSNVIDDVVSGLSFTLNTLSADSNDNISIGVEADTAFGEQIVRDFVETYNLFLGQVKNLTTPTVLEDDAEDLTPGSLSRDPTSKGMISEVRSLVSSTINGLSGDYTALATIGIKTELSGEISINENQFKSVLANNFSAMTDLFTGKATSSDARVDIVKTKGTTASGSFAVEVTTQPAKGVMAGNAILAGDVTALGLDTLTGSFGAGLDTSAGDYSFKVTVDGTTSGLITLSGNYADTDALIADLQAKINGDSALSGVAAALDISYNAGATGSFSATSREYGSASKVSFSSLSSDMAQFGLGTSAGQLKAGVLVETFAAPLNTALGDYSFDIAVDGAAASTITLSGAYADAEEVRAALNTAISGVTVSYDTSANKFVFTSQTTGVSSDVVISAPGADIANLGIGAAAGVLGRAASTSTAGTDVVGTIDGVAAFGSGNILLPALGSSLEGLSLQISPGVTSATINLSRGFSNEVNNILDNFLKTSGLIDTRETRMNTQLSDLKTDREKLDLQMEVREAQLQSQFLAMERIISSLSSTGGQLDSLTDRLPFTFKS